MENLEMYFFWNKKQYAYKQSSGHKVNKAIDLATKKQDLTLIRELIKGGKIYEIKN